MKSKILLFFVLFSLGCRQNIEHYKNDLLPNVKIFVENELKEDSTLSFLKFDTIYINRIDTLTPKERSTYFANVLQMNLELIKMNSNSIRESLNIKKNRSYLKFYGVDLYSMDSKEWDDLDKQQKNIDNLIIPIYTKTIDSLRKIRDSTTQYEQLYSAGIIYRFVKRNFTLDSGSRYIWFNNKLNLIEPNKNFNNNFSNFEEMYQKTNDLYLKVSRH